VFGAERRFGVGWAIGAWFVPVLNFWRPKQTANDIWSASDPTAEGKHLGSPLLTWWWLCFLLANWVGWIGAVDEAFAFAGD